MLGKFWLSYILTYSAKLRDLPRKDNLYIYPHFLYCHDNSDQPTRGYLFRDSYTFGLCACPECIGRKSSDLSECNQTHRAAIFPSKGKTFVSFPGHSFRVNARETWYVLPIHRSAFDFCLISNTFSCPYASITLRMKLLRLISSVKIWCETWKFWCYATRKGKG